jgi:predicted TIM-barrel fold metal-dependent hydrolase
VIDVHQHAFQLTVYGNPLGPNNPLRILCVNDRVPCDNPPSRFTTDAAVLQGTLEYMRRYNIVRAYVSANDPGQLRIWTQAAPGRFVAGPYWNNMATAPTIDALRQAFKRNEYGLLGEIGTQYRGLAPNDKALDPYFALAEELDIPVLTHTLGLGARLPSFRVAGGNPTLLEDVLTRHPKLRLYVENAGYPFGDQMIAMLYQYPQLYAVCRPFLG